jgi:hypothetical protein
MASTIAAAFLNELTKRTASPCLNADRNVVAAI